MHPSDDVTRAAPSSPPRPDWEGPVVDVLVRRDPGVPMPTRARSGDAGLDLVTTTDVTLPPGGRRTVGTGVSLALPLGTAAFVLPRSGLAAHHGVTVLNAPGTVDAGYRGEVRVTLLNTDTTTAVELRAGDRVAQLVVVELPAVHLVEVQSLPGSERGEGGFGSTGRGPAGAAVLVTAHDAAGDPGPDDGGQQ